jgi:hypothetical protein
VLKGVFFVDEHATYALLTLAGTDAVPVETLRWAYLNYISNDINDRHLLSEIFTVLRDAHFAQTLHRTSEAMKSGEIKDVQVSDAGTGSAVGVMGFRHHGVEDMLKLPESVRVRGIALLAQKHQGSFLTPRNVQALTAIPVGYPRGNGAYEAVYIRDERVAAALAV